MMLHGLQLAFRCINYRNPWPFGVALVADVVRSTRRSTRRGGRYGV